MAWHVYHTARLHYLEITIHHQFQLLNNVARYQNIWNGKLEVKRYFYLPDPSDSLESPGMMRPRSYRDSLMRLHVMTSINTIRNR